MAKGWKCGRCSTQNDEGTYNCSNCGLIKGGVVVPGSWSAPATWSSSGSSPPQRETTPQAPESGVAATESAADEGVGVPATLDFGEAAPTSGWVLPNPEASAKKVPLWRRIPLRLAFIAIVLSSVRCRPAATRAMSKQQPS